MKKIRFDSSNGLVKVAVTISGNKKKDYQIVLAIDTGSYLTTIRPETLSRVGYEELGHNVILTGMTQSVTVRLVMLNELLLSDISIKNCTLANHDIPGAYDIDGVIGNDILQNFKVTIDYPNQTITFE